MKKIMAVAVTLCTLFLIFSILPIHGEGDLYSDVLRLHVLAHSDSEEDQALKLKVRDAILSESANYLKDCGSREEAERAILDHKNELIQAAKEVICTEGFDYPVTIELGEEVYPTRNYESFCFPSGEYLSLRVQKRCKRYQYPHPFHKYSRRSVSWLGLVCWLPAYQLR